MQDYIIYEASTLKLIKRYKMRKAALNYMDTKVTDYRAIHMSSIEYYFDLLDRRKANV